MVVALAKHMPNVTLPTTIFSLLRNLEKEKLKLVQACKAVPKAVTYKQGISDHSKNGRVNSKASLSSNNLTTYNTWKLVAHC
jgi:hypothetical protein